MSDGNPPDDVAALLSRTHLSGYKVFSEGRRGRELPARSGEPTAMRPSDTPAAASPEPSKLEFVRPQARWSVLQNLAGESDASAPRGDSAELRVPSFAICSTGGGSGKTTISATLGRAFSMTGENVLMIHGAQQSSTPLHFGAQLTEPYRLRTFVPPVRNQGSVHILGHEFDDGSKANEDSGGWLLREVNSLQGEVDRCILEISSPWGSEGSMLSLARVCLVVLTPDVNSILALAGFRKLFERGGGARHPLTTYFLLNKFDPESAFHAEVRQSLKVQLGSRLLPFCIRRNDAIAEALAAGMTVLDYAPKSGLAEDFERLASWAREAVLARRSQGAV